MSSCSPSAGGDHCARPVFGFASALVLVRVVLSALGFFGMVGQIGDGAHEVEGCGGRGGGDGAVDGLGGASLRGEGRAPGGGQRDGDVGGGGAVAVGET